MSGTNHSWPNELSARVTASLVFNCRTTPETNREASQTGSFQAKAVSTFVRSSAQWKLLGSAGRWSSRSSRQRNTRIPFGEPIRIRSSFRGAGPLSASGWSGAVPILGHQVRDENPGAEREDDDDGA